MEPKILAKPIHQQPLDELQLIQQVGEWATKNFRDKRGAEWGIIEEVGEAAHCILKARQKIRGFDNHEFFLEKFSDSLADTIIYLADWCYMHEAFFRFGRNQMHPEPNDRANERRIATHLLNATAQMISFPEIFPGDAIPRGEYEVYNMVAQRICTGIEYWAEIYLIDIRWMVAHTWAKVSQRDWIANPTAPLTDQV